MGPGIGSILGPVCCTTYRPRYWSHERCARKSQNRTSWDTNLQANTGVEMFFCYFRCPFLLAFSAPFCCTYESKNRKSGPVFWSLQHIDIYIYFFFAFLYNCCCVQFRGVFLRSKMLPIWAASWLQFLATKTALSSSVRQFLRLKRTPTMTTCRRTSNAFKNGALMSCNIGSPFSNACTHPNFERIYCRSFLLLRRLTLISSKPYSSRVFLA